MTDHDAACTLDIPVKRGSSLRPWALLAACVCAAACGVYSTLAAQCWPGQPAFACAATGLALVTLVSTASWFAFWAEAIVREKL